MELYELTIEQARQGLRSKEFSSVELTEEFLARIKKYNPEFSAFLLVDEQGALQQAREADKKLEKGEKGSELLGVPVAIKDNMVIRGQVTTGGSKILENYVPPYTASAVEALFKAGAVVLGKTNMDEFAMGVSTENSAYVTTKNPWDKTRVPGGSSGGSAAALSADLTVYALGSDTNGSIRQPAGFCNVVGLRPTYGQVSRAGLLALTSSFDQIGPMTKSVKDAAIVMNHIAGFDEKDATTVKRHKHDFLSRLDPGLRGLRIGLPKEYNVPGMDPEVAKRVEEAVGKLRELGAEVKEVSTPSAVYSVPAYYVITPVEAASNLGRYDGIKYGLSVQEQAKNLLDVYLHTRDQGFGPEVKRRIIVGTYASSAGYFDQYYKKAQRVQQAIRNDFKKVFQEVDMLVSATSPNTAFKIGEKVNDPVAMYLEDVLTSPAAVAGLPAISLPCGLADGLPVGLQITGNWWGEDKILHAAYAFEQATEFHKLKPKLG